MTFLITGATGFIGRALVQRLLETGHNVNYAGRRRNSTMDSRAAFHWWEAGKEPPVDTMPDLDAVVHLAGEPVAQRWSHEVKNRIYNSRVEGTRQLVSALGRLPNKPRVLVSASAIGYYGSRGSELLTEQSGPGKDFLAEACVAWEREAARAGQFGIRVVNPRISVVLGLGGGALPKMAAPFRMGIGGQLGDGRQYISWIHLEDLVELLIFAVQSEGVKGAMNAASPAPVTNKQFTADLAHAMHRPALFAVPKLALHALMGEMAGTVLASQRVIPTVPQAAGFSFRYPDLRPALTELMRA